MYSKLRQIKRFSTKSEVDSIIGKPKFQLTDRLVYYYGKGILVAYSPRCFKVEGSQRNEYGEEGVYATSFYHFADVEMINVQFRINDFETEDALKLEEERIDDDIAYNMSFQDIHNMALDKKIGGYREGETQVMVNRKMEIQNLFIMYGQYTLFFRGKSKKNKMSGFQFTFRE